jgi:succinylglutamate desuccinylase
LDYDPVKQEISRLASFNQFGKEGMVLEKSFIIGDVHSSPSAGSPTLIVMTALHGNEPAGVTATKRVIAELEKMESDFHGRLISLLGNPEAYAANLRYQDIDLNRLWSDEILPEPPIGKEGEFISHLKNTFLTLVNNARQVGPVYVLDLHTASGESPPFMGVANISCCIDFARHFPLPCFRGLEERGIEGLFYVYSSQAGIPTLMVEGGQHAASSSVKNLEASIWTALFATGCLQKSEKLTKMADSARTRLKQLSATLPDWFEIFHIHACTPEDEFVMRSGFRSFQPVSKGECLASDRNGKILSPADGMILLPLYQKQGTDGFFLIRETNGQSS